jgi:hypothetical protein
MRLLVFAMLIAAAFETSAWAGAIDPSPQLFSTRPIHDPWRVSWATPDDPSAPARPHPFRSLAFASALLPQDAQPVHAAAIEHSSAFRTRSKIHKYASFATLPLFATEVALGQSLYTANSTTDAKRGAHAAVGAGITALFGVETVTGLWNMFGKEGRMDKEGRTRRLVHGLLMLAADIGFVATTASAPGHEGGRSGPSYADSRSTHRTLAIASISVGTAGYLVMLLGNH